MLKDINLITDACIAAAIAVHRGLGPGLLEKIYQRALMIELEAAGLFAVMEVPIQATYRGQLLGLAYYADIIVDKRVLLELKCVERLCEAHRAQTLTYLKQGGYRIGLLFNFHASPLMDDFGRIINGRVPQ